MHLAGRAEQALARQCDGALTVSRRFQQWLQERWAVQARVLYDTAPAFFQPVEAEEVCCALCMLRDF